VADARACALTDAKRQVQQRLGSAVSVQIKGGFIKDEYNERRKTGGGIVHDGWVLVAYPHKEVKKAEARIANRVLLGVSCNSDTIGACDNRVLRLVESAATKARLKPAPKPMEGAYAEGSQIQHALKQAETQRAAKLLLAVVNGKFLSSSDGEFYSKADCFYRLVNAVDGKVIKSSRFGPVKSGHINRKAAVAKAVDACTAKMVSAMANEL
jgi:hypothetical protein